MSEKEVKPMITEHTEKMAREIIKYLDKQVMLSETNVDWIKIHWIECIDRMINCLKIAPESYKDISKEDIEDRFYLSECESCGWWGSSKFLDGGGAIADMGDHFDCNCPVCGSVNISEKERTL